MERLELWQKKLDDGRIMDIFEENEFAINDFKTNWRKYENDDQILRALSWCVAVLNTGYIVKERGHAGFPTFRVFTSDETLEFLYSIPNRNTPGRAHIRGM
jgi:hypothetical protein